jgi:hypothetical protein
MVFTMRPSAVSAPASRSDEDAFASRCGKTTILRRIQEAVSQDKEIWYAKDPLDRLADVLVVVFTAVVVVPLGVKKLLNFPMDLVGSPE